MNGPTSRLSRRHALQGGAALGLAAATGAAQAAATTAGSGSGRKIPLAFNDPIWNRETRATNSGYGRATALCVLAQLT